MKLTKTKGLAASLLLAAGTATAQTVFTPGVLRYQQWTSDNPNGVQNPSRATVEAGGAGAPTTDRIDLAAWDIPPSALDNFAERVSGLFIAPATTNYVFYVCSDDDGDLFLSTDETAANKRLIAQETGWSNADQWTAVGSGSVTAKCSSTYTDANGAAPNANGIPLIAGHKYWIEGVKHEGGGGDDFGVTYRYVGEPAPANGSASRMTGNVIGYGYTIPTSLTVKADVTNAAATIGAQASFAFGVADPIPDPLTYQWYRNGTAVAGASGAYYTFIATPADSAAQYKCVAGIPASYNSSLSITSAVGTLTVNSSIATYTNTLKVFTYSGALRAQVEAGAMAKTTDIRRTGANGFELPVNDGINDYTRRVAGFFLPPTTGKYVFFLSSDDDSDLFLSSDNTPANKKLVAHESVYSNSREWITSGGSSDLAQKRSDQITDTNGTVLYPDGIQLTAGQQYYIEAVHHQGGSGDNLAVLAQLAGQPDPTNGTPPIPASQLSMITPTVTSLAFVTAPKALSVFEGDTAQFNVLAKSDSEFLLNYQWRKDGTNVVGGINATTYGLQTVALDNGSMIDVIVSTVNGELSITSAPVMLTVHKGVFETGLLKMEYWVNKSSLADLENNILGTPDFVMAVPAFEVGDNNENGSTYVNRVTGYIIPATTGDYDFITSSDDQSDLFISKDDKPANKYLIAQQPGWNNALTWTTDGAGGTDLQQRRSSTWQNSSAVAPWANGIHLIANTKYYIEVDHLEGGGGDNVAVTMLPHGAANPADGTASTLTGTLIGFTAQAANYIAFTNQPQNVTVTSGQTATFSAGGISDGNIPIGTTGQFQTGTTAGDKAFVSFPYVLFQWFKNGTAIAGATSPSYTTPLLKAADNGEQFYCAIRALGIADWSNSTPAVVTVNQDAVKPEILWAGYSTSDSYWRVTLHFSKLMDAASMTNIANYSVAGGTIIAATAVENGTAVVLEMQGPISGALGTVSLTGITDFSGNSLVANSAQIHAVPLTNVDIGDSSLPDPAWPGYLIADNTNAFTIQCEGSDIWNAADGFNFSYEQKTGDFDVVVRHVSTTHTSNWAKGGLMIRETLAMDSRNWNIVNDPVVSDGIQAPDGSGMGANTIEPNARLAASAASASWANQGVTIPPPAYPNAWVRLTRTNQTLTAYFSADGMSWTKVAVNDVTSNTNDPTPLPDTVYVGICCTAHNNDAYNATTLKYYYVGSFADYTSNYKPSAVVPKATLKAAISGNNLVISWTPAGGHLESKSTLGTGAWTTVGTANPATVPLTGTAQFFRVANP